MKFTVKKVLLLMLLGALLYLLLGAILPAHHCGQRGGPDPAAADDLPGEGANHPVHL